MKKNIRNGMYTRILSQFEELIAKYPEPLSRMATLNALLYHKIDSFYWVGFYLLSGEQLLVGPYQGPLACISLEKDRGVCWTGVNQKKTIIVPDVHKFPGHIACDPKSRSEIVVPVFREPNNIAAVLDIDSRLENNFDESDAIALEKMASLIYT